MTGAGCARLRPAVAVILTFALSGGIATAQTKPTQKPPAKPVPKILKPLPSRPVVLSIAREPGRPGSFELSVSALWLGSGSAGTGEANLTRNQAGGSGSGYTWFRTEGQYASATGVRAALGYNVSRTLAVEAGLAYAPSNIRYVVSDDVELTSGFASPNQRLSEYSVDVTAVARVRALAFAGGRGRPFILAGGGYLRQVHAGSTLIETAQIYYGGGGVKYLLGSPRARGLVRAFGLRLDARVCVRSGGFRFSGSSTVSPAASAGIVAAF